VAGLEFDAYTFTPGAEDETKGTVALGMLSRLLNGTYEVLPPAKKDDPAHLRITSTLFSISTTREFTFVATADALQLTQAGSSLTRNYVRDAAITGAAATT
jgi:hypothetical protein